MNSENALAKSLEKLTDRPTEIQNEQNLAVIRAVVPKTNLVGNILKRLVDWTISITLLFVFLPLFPLIALAILTGGKGPVFYTQERLGFKGKRFKCYKLRTMRPEHLSYGMTDTERITSFGMLLRKSHFDELPQLFNVMRGDMSLVGPRPYNLKDNKRFAQIIPNYNMRHFVRPGITGLAQSKGFFGTVKSSEDLKMRTYLDFDYVESWSCKTDIRILIDTLSIIYS